MKSSGLFFGYKDDGSVYLGYEDYDVEFFDGYDYEVTYILNRANFDILCQCLKIVGDQDVRDILISTFGYYFDSIKFENFCQQNGIIFNRYIHIG